MGEYAKFSGQEIKIGTCEDMYYLRFDQRGLVDPLPNSVNPKGKDALGLRFRFPFPDEDNIQPGGFDDFDRGLRIDGFPLPGDVSDHYNIQFRAGNGYLVSLPCPESGDTKLADAGIKIAKNGYGGALKLKQQKLLADGRLVPVVACGGCGAAWRIEDPDQIAKFIECVRAMADEKYSAHRNEFWSKIADRIAKGAKLELANS